MLNTRNIGTMLRWAMENIGCPIEEIDALDGIDDLWVGIPVDGMPE